MAADPEIQRRFAQLPISRIPEFISRVDSRLAATLTACDICYVGHVGDGNIHVVLVFSREADPTPEASEAGAPVANEIVQESVRAGGSISAEHGIGLMHVDRLRKYKAPLDLKMMARIKAAFDPENLMNPAKIICR